MKMRLMAGIAGVMLIAGPAFAQGTTVEERTTTVKRTNPDGTTQTIELPTEVRTYVTGQDVPAVTYGQPIVVGQRINGQVVWLNVPSYPKYRWAYLDGHRVVVDADTHAVVAVY